MQAFGSAGLGSLPGASFGSTQAMLGSQLPTSLGSKDSGFDPLAPIDVDKLNAAFISRHQAALLGSHLRA
jgi:hypothetical protein